MKIIVIGCGQIGRSLVESLARDGHEVTTVDTSPEKLERLTSALDVYGIAANGASYQALAEAGVRQADMLIATTGSDETNLLCCLIARRAGVRHVVARVRTPLYVDDIRFFQEEMGVSLAICPELVTAQEISRLIRFPSAIKVETFNHGRVELLEVRIPEKSPVCGKAIAEASAILKSGALICMVGRNGEITIPDGRFVLQAGDRITVIVPPGHSGDFFNRLGVENNAIRSVILAGGGPTAYYLARILLNEGIKVKLIEQKAERAMQLSELLPGATIIQGDCTDKDLLDEEGIDAAECFMSLTDRDEENIMLSMYVGVRSKAKIVTQIHHINFDEVVEHLPIGSVIYPKEVVAGILGQYVRAMQNSMGSNIETLHRLGDGAEALEFLVSQNSPLVGIPLQDLQLKKNLLVCSITHHGRTIAPRGRDVMQAGDAVIIVTTNKGLNDLKDILK